MKCINIFIVLFLIINTIQCTVTGDKKVNLPKLNKCCSAEEYVGKIEKQCTPNSADHSTYFSHIPIFNYEVKKTNKTVDDTFEVVPGKFKTDGKFQKIARSSIMMHAFKVYLIENASLYRVLPNSYDSLTKIDSSHFCVDFYMSESNGIQFAFWITPESDTGSKHNKSEYFQNAAMFVSCFFLLLVLIVYALLAELRNLGGMILIAYVVSLFFALLFLAIIRIQQHSENMCYGLTLLVYFFFLACFCWMNVMSYDIWWTFRGYAKARPIHRRGEPIKYMMYSIYAWGVPLALTIMLVSINASDLSDKPWVVKPFHINLGCFIEGAQKIMYLYIPMLILICSNWMFYLMTAFNIWRLSRGTSVLDSAAAGTRSAHRTHRNRFLLYLKLSVVMGLNWVLEVVSYLVPWYMWYLTDVYNILIGVFIFFIFVCKRKVMRKLKKLYIRQSKNQWHPGNSTTRSNSKSSENSQETQTLQLNANPKGPGYVINNF